MNIWDEISKSVSDAANFTVKKTGELTNAAKLKVNLHLETTKLEKCFEEIGRLYYEGKRAGKDNFSEISALFVTADEIKINISIINEEIAKLKNVITCPGCGSEVNRSFAYCNLCGTKLVVPNDKPESDTCNCGCTEETNETCNCGCTEETNETCNCGCTEETNETCNCGCTEETSETCNCGCTEDESKKDDSETK